MSHTLFRSLLVCAVVLATACSGSTDKPGASKKVETLETPDGPITVTTTTIDNTPQTIVPATADQIAAIQAMEAQGKAFVNAYLPGVHSPTLKDYDEAFGMWQQEATPRFTPQHVISTLGAALGMKMREDLPLEWVVVQDAAGTDYALRGLKVEVVTYPFASVSKRLDRRDEPFMASLHFSVKHMLANGGHQKR